jgi:phosphatidylinositol 4-kinase B
MISSKFIDEKRVFDDVEFYLPQLAHMVIHLDVDWNNKALERFAILISEASLHTALQLSFILTAAMEDFQPENKHGERNPNGNPTLFFRCARLLQNVERAVVFGAPELTADEEEELGRKHATSKQIEDEDFSARFNHITHDNVIKLVNRIVDSGGSTTDRDQQKTLAMKPENLLYKRIERKGIFYRKPWKSRYVTIEQRVLIIYHDETAPLPLRALPLQGCVLITREDAKYPYYLEIFNPSTQTKFLLRASSQASYDKWLALIRR